MWSAIADGVSIVAGVVTIRYFLKDWSTLYQPWIKLQWLRLTQRW